ncbi:MAG: hypothetical protein KIT56_08305 [Gammaproteobacteria bacterium]|nr:hypothetical protein [Gammaproteobacteria bacterium]MCW5583861.1 hypothetical protein [Gammaproteobacteria bacterium]
MNTTVAANNRANLNTLSHDEKKALIKKTYSGCSYFQDLFHHDHVEVDCMTSSIAFRNEIERLLWEKNLVKEKIALENLHEVLSDEIKAYNFNDGVNKLSTFFYDTDKQFQAVYHQYIKFLREHFVKEPFWFQDTPTIRIHCPNAENSHHYPRYHSDISYGHPPEEMNIWLPLTDLLDGHSFRTLSVEASNQILEKYDYDFDAFIHDAIHDKAFTQRCESVGLPVNTPFGNMLAFDSRCVHSGEPMKSHTRVSMDIRILPLSQYEKMEIEYQGAGRRKILFTPGNCYHTHDSDHLLYAIGTQS